MDRLLETYRFGRHTVAVVEHLEDEGPCYSVLVDDVPAGAPVDSPLTLDDVVRIYARALREREAEADGA
ncbi:MAG TPA: hypothetical protein VFH38_08520 [Jatrophihabitans sp.]|nr:hypothetical protein [Jatrophihabitans sp.]